VRVINGRLFFKGYPVYFKGYPVIYGGH
jgi:hypothetical protein